MKVGNKRQSPAIIISLVALVVALTGTAYAALAPHSVSSRQLKPRSVTGKKIADSAVNSEKVAKRTLVGSDFKVSEFSTVPNADSAKTADNTILVNGHQAACPANGSILIRGACYDSGPAGPVLGVRAAADACADRGGFLPSPGEALSIRGAVPLGNGVGSNSVFTDTIVGNTEGVEFGTTVVSNAGATFVENEVGKERVVVALYDYVCVYELVHK